MRILLLISFVACCADATSWRNLSCPAPRAPDNGLSFIFRDGEMVHYRCHPGYSMRGRAVVHCRNNTWTEPVPECVRDGSQSLKWRSVPSSKSEANVPQRSLFNWGNSVYGDGPRRLPLINGIWPPVEQAEQVLALGTISTPGPKILIKEEIDIAELRNKQLEELRKQRYKDISYRSTRNRDPHPDGNSILLDRSVPRETVVSLVQSEEGQALSVSLSKLGKSRHRHGTKRKPSAPFVISRASRVDTGPGVGPLELRRRPVESVLAPFPALLDELDTSCVESVRGREVPMLAPQVPNAFVYRYETKKNKRYPFNRYMQVRYRCHGGFAFESPGARTLFCKQVKWIGDTPKCKLIQNW